MMSDAPAWQIFGIGAALGGVAAFAQAPYDLPLALLIAFGGVFFVFDSVRTPKRAALLGWAVGAGYFAHALQWLVSPFFVDVARHGWMAPFALFFMAAGLALFWGAAFGLARLLGGRLWGLACCWAGAEMVRAYVFTGFPWAMPAQATVDAAWGQALGWAGPHGVTFSLLLSVALAMSLPGLWLRIGVACLAAAALLIGPQVPQPTFTGHVMRLVQPNAAQRDKWDPEKIPVFLDRKLKYTAAAPVVGLTNPDLVIWPETAIPWLLNNAESVLAEIGAAGGGVPVTLGVQRQSDQGYHNSLVVLGAGGQVNQLYDKHHLVPFGEYLPFAPLLSRLGLGALAARFGGYAAGQGPQMLDFGPLGKALPLICYEAVFAHDVNGAPERPAFLIQITNDAWFGKGAGPKQHLAQARMRAIEQGLPLARSANTGISAMIDPYGRLLDALPLNTTGFIDAALPAPLPPTLYSRTGDLPWALLMLVGIGLGAFQNRRSLRLTA